MNPDLTTPTLQGAAAPANDNVILDISSLTKFFGGLRAVGNFDMTLNKGDLVGLIGPNGAGKTTIFNMITGIYVPSSGDVRFLGESIVGTEPHLINQLGIARTFQNIRLFPSLTVLDNVRIAYHPHSGYSLKILSSIRAASRSRRKN